MSRVFSCIVLTCLIAMLFVTTMQTLLREFSRKYIGNVVTNSRTIYRTFAQLGGVGTAVVGRLKSVSAIKMATYRFR